MMPDRGQSQGRPTRYGATRVQSFRPSARPKRTRSTGSYSSPPGASRRRSSRPHGRRWSESWERRGIAVDRGCKNINRLYFSCVTPSREAWLGARVLGGGPIDVDALLAVARREDEERRRREEAERARRPPRAHARGAPRQVRCRCNRKRASQIAGAGEGGRHDALLKAVFALARPALGLTEAQSRTRSSRPS